MPDSPGPTLLVSVLKLTQILRVFYRTALPALPVVALPVEEGRLLGFLVRSTLDLALSDYQQASREYLTIPENLIEEELDEEWLALLSREEKIPFLSAAGVEQGVWSPSILLHATTQLSELLEERREQRGGAAVSTQLSSVNHATDAAELGQRVDFAPEAWITELTLATLPLPLLAVDLQGETLFYNAAFHKELLESRHFKGSLRLLEHFFREWTQNELARVLLETGAIGPLRRRPPPGLNYFVDILSLEGERGLVGYLYQFHLAESRDQVEEMLARLDVGSSIDDLLANLEREVITTILERSSNNVTHAAERLGVGRTTLQHRLKKLEIDLPEPSLAPRPRRRSSAGEAASQKSVSKKVEPKSAGEKKPKRAAKKSAKTGSGKKRAAKKV